MPSGHQGILIDKCLSKRLAVGLSRFKGFQGEQLATVFTNHSHTQDVQFIEAAGEHGWAVFTQNDKMLKNPAEMEAIRQSEAKVFTLTNSHLGLDGAGLVFGRWLVTIRRRLDQPGPCFWRLYEDRKVHDIK